MHEGAWYGLEKRVYGLKKRYALKDPTEFELHAADFSCSIKEQEEIDAFESLARDGRRNAVLQLREQKLQTKSSADRTKRKLRYRSTDRFVHLTRSERTELMRDVLDLVGTHDGIRLFAEACDKQHYAKSTGAKNCLRNNFTQVVSRFDSFLRFANDRTNSGRPEKGMLIFDNEPSDERALTEMLSEFRKAGHPWGNVQHVIETPLFVDSRLAAGIQLADVCAYTLRRYVEADAERRKLEEGNFQRIFHKFDRAKAKLHGVRHYCPRDSCKCSICQERGHYGGELEE